jgi:hypothetical protein
VRGGRAVGDNGVLLLVVLAVLLAAWTLTEWP